MFAATMSAASITFGSSTVRSMSGAPPCGGAGGAVVTVAEAADGTFEVVAAATRSADVAIHASPATIPFAAVRIGSSMFEVSARGAGAAQRPARAVTQVAARVTPDVTCFGVDRGPMCPAVRR